MPNGILRRLPSDVRYVITLDADTRLPRETARRLVGKMAHPLNRPRFDAGTGRVVEGYAVLQPRVAPSLPVGREGSIFQRVFSSASGIDPYAAAVSDVYQDLFGEGSYAGKGIYDVDAFEAALAGRVPDGTLLSHDLFEGIFARAGLVSDIEVVEEFPSRYDVAAARQHRWARGDWQLLPWIFGRGDCRGRRARQPRPAADRPVEDVGQSAADAVGAGECRGAAGRMGIAAQRLAGLDRLRRTDDRACRLCCRFFPRSCRTAPASRCAATFARCARMCWLAASQSALQIIFLAYQAWLMIDAIGRTLFRLFVSRRNLLQWVTAAQANLRVPGWMSAALTGAWPEASPSR